MLKCTNCGASNKKSSDFCSACGERLTDDFKFYKKIKSSAFTAFIMGLLGFELFYILSDFLIIHKESYDSYMFLWMIVPVLGVAGSLLYAKFKITSGIVMLFSGLIELFPYIFFLGSLSFISEIKNLTDIHNLLFILVTLPGIISGILFIKTSYSSLKFALSKEVKDIKIPIITTLFISLITAVFSYIVFLNIMGV